MGKCLHTYACEYNQKVGYMDGVQDTDWDGLHSWCSRMSE